MASTAREGKGLRRVAAWWHARTPRGRQRILLGSLVGLALAARDVVLLTFAGGMLAALELAPDAAPRPQAA